MLRIPGYIILLFYSLISGSAVAGLKSTGNGQLLKSDTLNINTRDQLKEDSLYNFEEGLSLDEIVITATRTPKSLKDVPVVTRVISSDEIGKSDATNIQDLLTEEIPGLEFGMAMSQETSLNMGGFGGSAVLFLVDGERMAGETMDNVDYNRLTMNDVGQVEIVKGAASALYGANAVGGVVNLISKENKAPWHINLNSRYNSFGNEWRSGLSASFNSKHWNSNTTFEYKNSDRVKLTSPFDTESEVHDYYEGQYYNIKERLVYRLNGNLRFIARGGYFNRESDRVTYIDHLKDYSAGLKGIYDIDPSQFLEISYSYDQYSKTRTINGELVHNHDYTNRQNIVHTLYTKFWRGNGLTVGGDFMHDFLTTYQFAYNENHSQTSADLFAQFDYNPFGWFNVIASIRDDYYSASRNNALTGRLALMFKLSFLSIRSSYSGGFRAPTLKEMYMDYDMGDMGTLMIYGNPDLKPERSHNFNLALEHSGNLRSGFLAGSYNITALGYYNYYDRRITTVDIPNPDPASAAEAVMYANEDGIRVTGTDITARYNNNSGFGVSANFNYYHVGGKSAGSYYTQPRPFSATWKLSYQKQLLKFWKLYAAISGRYLGKPITNEATQDQYDLWKFTLQQTFFKGVTINFMIDNLFNYKPKVYYFNSPMTDGIAFNIGIALNLDELF